MRLPKAAHGLKILQRVRPLHGIAADFRSRRSWYKADWRDGLNSGYRILAPATYIFFASAIPALAFGEQLSGATGGILTGVQVLTATAFTGLLQAVVGGQPLLIVGVAEPIVLTYGYMYSFAQGRAGLGQELFLAWCGWTCIWASIMILALAALGSCTYIDRFTRFSGELFGMLIAVLFMQEAIRGVLLEFHVDSSVDAVKGPGQEFQWRLANGLWGLFLAFGLVITSLKSRQARRWRFGTAPLRGFVADYGVPLMVAAFTCLSYALSGAPPGVPRRLTLPNTWDVTTTWTVAQDLHRVSGTYIAAALIPALIIVVLFFFDHNVSSLMAQQQEFNLRRPSAYHYDFALLALMTLACGLIGVPPVNGVLPQAPLHTKSLITLKEQLTLRQLAEAKRKNGGASSAQLLRHMAEATEKLASSRTSDAIKQSPSLQHLREEGDEEAGSRGGDWAEEMEAEVLRALPAEAQEQRLTNLLQSLLVAACLGITPGLKKIPSAVLWGYFAYLSLASLPGSQFWERFLLLFVDPKLRPPKRAGIADAPFMEQGVLFRVIAALTIFQAAYTGAVYGITWIPIAGVIFPIPIMLLVPIRQHVMPRIFGRETIAALDPAVFERPVEPPGEATNGSLELRNGSLGQERPGCASGAAPDGEVSPDRCRGSEEEEVVIGMPAAGMESYLEGMTAKDATL